MAVIAFGQEVAGNCAADLESIVSVTVPLGTPGALCRSRPNLSAWLSRLASEPQAQRKGPGGSDSPADGAPNPQPGDAERLKRWVWALVPLVIALAVAVTLLPIKDGDGDDDRAPPALEVKRPSGEPAQVSVEVTDGDASEAFRSQALSPVVELASETRGPFVLEFPIPADIRRDRLAVATREAEGEMWTLRLGRVVGGEYLVRTPSFSQWQLLELPAQAARALARIKKAGSDFFAGLRSAFVGAPSPAACGATTEDRVLTEKDPHGLISACLETAGRFTRLRVVNHSGLALEFGLSEGFELERVSGGSLAEGVWAEINRGLSAETAAILPAGAELTIVVRETPQSLSLRLTSTAFWMDAALSWLTRGRSGAADGSAVELAQFAQCVYTARSGGETETIEEGPGVGLSLWADCGQLLIGTKWLAQGAGVLDLIKIGRGAVDLPRLGQSAGLEVDRAVFDQEAGPDQLIGQGASCGGVEETLKATEASISVEVGVVGGAIVCQEALDVVREFISTNECIGGGNTCQLEVGEFVCSLPSSGSYPRAVDCSSPRLRLVGIDSAALEPRQTLRPCGTAPGATVPGPYKVEATGPCAGAQALAAQLTNAPCLDEACVLLPFRCESQAAGYESARHTCVFGRNEISFATGV